MLKSNKEITINDRQKLLFIFRKLNKLTQKQVAEKAGVSYSQYKRLENHKMLLENISLDVANRIFSVLMGFNGAEIIYSGQYDWLIKYDATKSDPYLKRFDRLQLDHLRNINRISEKDYKSHIKLLQEYCKN